MSYTREDYELYCLMTPCLDSQAYAGKEFEDKCFQFLDDSQGMTQEQRRVGWEELHKEYERLSEPHWQRVRDQIGTRELKQAELFA